MAKLWAGRAEKETAQIADDFNSSLHFDCRMYRQAPWLTPPCWRTAAS